MTDFVAEESVLNKYVGTPFEYDPWYLHSAAFFFCRACVTVNYKVDTNFQTSLISELWKLIRKMSHEKK